jgi:carbon monoxide dehydrogenase subunit G
MSWTCEDVPAAPDEDLVDLLVTREIAAPQTQVWAIVTDLEATPTTLSGVDRVERLDDSDGFGVGTRWRETRTMFGKQATEEMAVTAIEPPRTYTVVAEHGTTTYTSVISVEAVSDARSSLTMRFHASTSSVVGRLLAATVGRAFAGATRKALQRDLDDIALRAEAGSS